MSSFPDAAHPFSRPTRVMHFVTGGFSGGATQVAIALTRAAMSTPDVEARLVLRRKRHTPSARLAELRDSGVVLHTVPGWSTLATIWALVRLCRKERPDVLICHGFSEHLWGRYAGLLAGVPHLVHVEHNTRERYTRWRLAQSRWLAKRTDRIVGCSEGVRQVLLSQGMPEARTISIANGISLAPFEQAAAHPFHEREPDILMVARFSAQKDHATLLRALALLANRGLRPRVFFAGGGKARHRAPLLALAEELGLTSQVEFLGVVRDVPERLMALRIACLSTHYEGMPLALIEGMAAGCAVVASAVPGVKEVIRDGVDGILVPPSNALALADALEILLQDVENASRLADAGRARASAEFSRERMNAEYAALCRDLVGSGEPPRAIDRSV